MQRQGLHLPYPTIVAFERATALLMELPEGARVDRPLLLAHGFAVNLVAPVVDGLRFTGLIDGAGRTRSGSRSFHADPAAAAGRALAPIVARLAPPYRDRKALVAALRPLTDMTETTLPLAATFLAWLSERAGVGLIVRARAKPGARPGRPKRSGARAAAAPEPSGEVEAPATEPIEVRPRVKPGARRVEEGRQPPPPVSFQVVVDRHTTPEDLERMVCDVRDAMERLSRA